MNNITIDETDDEEIYNIVVSDMTMDCEDGIHNLMLSLIPPFGSELLLQNFSKVSTCSNSRLPTSVYLCFNQQKGSDLCDYVNNTKNMMTLKPEDSLTICNGKSAKGTWTIKFKNVGESNATVSSVTLELNCAASTTSTDSNKNQIKSVSLFTVACVALFIPFFALSFKYYVVDKYQLLGWFKKQRIWKTFNLKPSAKDWTMLE